MRLHLTAAHQTTSTEHASASFEREANQHLRKSAVNFKNRALSIKRTSRAGKLYSAHADNKSGRYFCDDKDSGHFRVASDTRPLSQSADTDYGRTVSQSNFICKITGRGWPPVQVDYTRAGQHHIARRRDSFIVLR